MKITVCYKDKLTRPEPIEIIIDCGTAPPEAIADFLADLSILCRLKGEPGIVFKPEVTQPSDPPDNP